jgi:hypothetical protein
MTLRELKSQVRAYLAREYADKNMLNQSILHDSDITAAINHAYYRWLDATEVIEGDTTKAFISGSCSCASMQIINIIRVEIDNAAIGYLNWKDAEKVVLP